MGQQGTFVDFNIDGAIGPLRGRDGVPRAWPYGDTVPETRWEIGRQIQRYGVRVYLRGELVAVRGRVSLPARHAGSP